MTTHSMHTATTHATAPNPEAIGTADVVRLLAVRETPLSLDEVYAAIGHDAAGGMSLFVGTVRDHDHGKGVASLDYSAHPTAEAELRRVADAVVAAYPVKALAAVHRTGSLAVGDVAVIVAVSCAHRSESFAACRTLIDDLKHTVPIWKHQTFADGEEEWVGAC